MVDTIEDIEDALSIPIASADNLFLDDTRRLTGPNMLWDHPGAVLDVFYDGIDSEKITKLWQHYARCVLDAIGWTDQKSIARCFDGGVNLAISAPIDQLYSAIFAAQTAWHFCAAPLLGQPYGDFVAMIDDLKSVMAREANPALIALIAEADEHNVDVLTDDDELSLGHGAGSLTWPVSGLPASADVAWGQLYDIPVALITGTNGKTTTTRLCAAIAKAAGKVAGLTSTEFVRVGDDILDHGDYSGPGGARMLLRDQRLEIAYLEVARGGILRRGLPLRGARAALVTNVAADHLGQYGVNTVADLAVAKFAVFRTLADDGVLVLNADDPYVVAQAARTPANICWFSLDPKTAQIKGAQSAGKPCAWLQDTALCYFDGADITKVIDVADIPLTMGGAARYNVSNALGALCISRAMGLSDEAICAGLSGFQNNPQDNPGRCNEFQVNGAKVFVDFAHNPHSIAAVAEAMAAIPAKRRIIMLSHAGDRSDQDIRDVTATALDLKPDYVVAVELVDYLRGRKTGEIPRLIADECLKLGMTNEQVIFASSPSDGAAQVLDWLRPDDLALLLVLSERDKIFEMLEQASGRPD
jgi:UDP-N-acetylmuramyl tripeptide synthase